jgi:copper(I)-binding protein
MAAGYGEIRNGCATAVAVVAAGSKAFGDVSLHETTLVDGVSRMRAVERLPIAPGASVVLKPGGLHLMLMQPEVPLAKGKQLPLRLSLEDGRKVDGTLQVR